MVDQDRGTRQVGLQIARAFGFGALIASGISFVVSLVLMAVFIGPLAFWFAWNVLDFGASMGLPELGFWATILATLFLTVGGFAKMVITAVVFMIDPDWFGADATLTWPEPTLKNFVAVAILATIASFPHHRRTKVHKDRKDRGSSWFSDVTVTSRSSRPSHVIDV